MKQYIKMLAVVLCVCTVLAGCSFWMDGEYLSVTPHQGQNVGAANPVEEISSYAELPQVLNSFVTSGAAGGAVTAPRLNDSDLRDYLDEVVEQIKHDTPIGAYAVENITYEVGTNRGDFAIAFHIEYYLNRSDILRIKHVKSVEEATSLIGGALDEFRDSVVVLVEEYQDTDFTQVVRNYANQNPMTVMEVPQVTTKVYPEEGDSRLIELHFTYQTDREVLFQMQEHVQQIFTSAELYVKEYDKVRDIYARLFSFIMERHDYSYTTSITPSYSLLHDGIGDGRALANVYAAMCRQVGLDCQVLSGTQNGTPWYWNRVRFRGGYYHVDLIQCSVKGEFKMLQDADMMGYVWE